MAMWLGKQYLGQKESAEEKSECLKKLDEVMDKIGGAI